MNWQTQYDQFGNPIGVSPITTTTAGNLTPSTFTYPPITTMDGRDYQINKLQEELINKECALKECYCEIGRLHEQIRAMQAFDKWSEGVAQKQAKL